MRCVRFLALALLLALLPQPAMAEDHATTWFVNDLTSNNGAGAFLSVAGPGGNANTATDLDAYDDGMHLTIAEKEPGFAAGYQAVGEEGMAFVYIKSWNNAPAPQTRVDVTVEVGEETVATGSQTKDVINGAIVEFAVPLAYTGGDIPAGQAVTLNVRYYDANTGYYNPATYSRGDDTNHWRLELPVVPVMPAAGAAPVFSDLTTPEVNLTLAFVNATTGSYVYNWTHALASLVLTVGGDVQAGNVSLAVLAGNETLYNGTITESLAANATLGSFQNVTAGDWQIVLDVEGFVGNVTLRLAAPLVEAPGPVGDGTGNVTGNATLDEVADAESPAWAVVSVLATLVLLARRRQR